MNTPKDGEGNMDSQDQSQAGGGAGAHTPGPYSAAFGAIRHEDAEGFIFTVDEPRFAGDVADALSKALVFPDLLEALKAAPIVSMYCKKDGFDDAGFFRDYETWSEMKRAAISKALGQ